MLLWVFCALFVVCFFFKQKTAYEMRISDWSSDVCSSDLGQVDGAAAQHREVEQQCFRRLFDLRRHAVAGPHAAVAQQARDACAAGVQLGVAHTPAVRRLEDGAAAIGREMLLQEGVEIGHRVVCLWPRSPRRSKSEGGAVGE